MSSLSCPYYMEDEIIRDFPMEQCDTCPNRKQTNDDEAIMYCAVSSDPNALRRSRINKNR